MILSKLKYIFNGERFSVHKIRMDRGGMYWSYFQMLSYGALLVGVFKIKAWWVWVLGVVAIFGFRYISGYWDEKRKILANEQSGYAYKNPWNEELMKKIDNLTEQINVLSQKNIKDN